MSKTSLFLLAILIIAAGWYSYIKLTPQKTTLRSVSQAISPSNIPTTTDISLSMSPVQSGQTIRVMAVISPAESKTGLIQLEIGFDPLKLTAVNILPGTYFANPKIYLKTVNQHTGRISYALGCKPNTNSTTCNKNLNQPVAIFTFTRSSYDKTPTTVHLLPKTLLKSYDNAALSFKTHDASITLSSEIVPAASKAAVSK
jgi:hypothetical protein